MTGSLPEPMDVGDVPITIVQEYVPEDFDASLILITGEDLNRLGHTYSYVAETLMNIVDTNQNTQYYDYNYNFRIGVFNNPIKANLSSYIRLETTDTEVSQDFVIPSNVELFYGYAATINANKSIELEYMGETYNPYNTEFYLFDTPHTLPITLSMADGEDEVTLTLRVKDSDSQTIFKQEYHVKFEAETDVFEEVTEDSTDYTSLETEDILNNAEYWSGINKNTNVWTNLECPFVYNENYPLYIIITGAYTYDVPFTDVKFLEPNIIEQTTYKSREDNGIFLTPILSVIDSNDTAELGLQASTQSNSVVLYDLGLDEDYGTNTEFAIRGISVSFTIEQADEQVLTVKLHNPKGTTGTRTLIIDDSDIDRELTIGGNGDLWGFNTLDMVDMNRWEIEVATSNILNDIPTNLNIGNAEITFYIEKITKQNIICKIEGEDISYYGAFITDLEVPAGLKTDTSYLTIDGTDTNDVYRQNIREKTIELEMEIGECDLNTSTQSLQQLTRLLVNEKDKYNRPIPKTIELSNYPDLYWEYIIEDTFDTNIDIGTYSIKAKLTVPAGTAYSTQSTVTNSQGYVQGLASINPVITATLTGTEVNIQEANSNQQFNMTVSSDWKGRIIEIDCEDRVVRLQSTEDTEDSEDITYTVSYDSDWFVLKNEFNFITTNCILRTVEYNQRW